ncbi:MAG: hypothetical protein HQK53_06070 [Oligoflexia bacterium]|nr:hypothetical protein [Oligoflexia bacterium]
MSSNFDYRSLLSKMAEFEHRVFTITMLINKNERHKLKMYIYHHPDLFTEIRETYGIIVFQLALLIFLGGTQHERYFR